MRSFDYYRPATMPEARELLAQHGEDARIMAGGTALLILLKQRLFAPSVLVDIKGIRELDYITRTDTLHIGALATHRALEESQIVKDRYPVLAQAAHLVAHQKIRNKGTVAGNLCQAEPASDLGTVLLAYEAQVKLAGPDEERILPLDQFFVSDYETDILPGEILTETILPHPSDGAKGAYYKFSPRSRADKPTVGLAVLLSLDSPSQIVRSARIALGNCGPTPLRCPKAEERLVGNTIDQSLAMEAGRIAAKEGKPVDDVRASADYRRYIVEVLLKRALLELAAH